MAEFKNMTVQVLRELARKALGRGQAKLKTKAELIAALQAAERKVATVANRAASTMKEATGRAARATEKMVETVRGGRERAATRAEAKRGAGARDRDKGGRTAGAAKAKGATARRREAKEEPRREEPKGEEPRREEPKEATRKGRGGSRPTDPDPEGYMVARVAGEDALRGAPHPMTESAVEEKRGARPPVANGATAKPGFEEHLGDLPWSYADDALTALPRDPKTLFLYWDHSQETLRQAWEGLESARPQLWVFAREPDGGWTRVRTLDIALESRSYYVHDLDPGRVYRAEIHVVDRHGREKLVPRVSNEMMLPPIGPSSIIDDRFMRLPWDEPLQRALREVHAGGPFPEEIRAQLARLSDWSRFAGRVWGGSAGGIGGRPFSPSSSPSASSPSLPWSRDPSGGEDR